MNPTYNILPEQTITHMEKNKISPISLTFTKIKSKWIKYLDTKTDALKLLQENLGETFEVIDTGKFPQTKL